MEKNKNAIHPAKIRTSNELQRQHLQEYLGAVNSFVFLLLRSKCLPDA